MKKWSRPLLCTQKRTNNCSAALAAAILSFCLCAPALSASLVDSIVAIVNNEILTNSDIEQFKKRLGSGAMVDDLLVEAAQVPELLSNRSALIQLMINERLLTSEVKKQGLDITMERVNKEVEGIASKNGLSKVQLIDTLRTQGIVFSEYQDFIKTRIERQSLIEQTITSKVKITEEEVMSYYLSHNGKAQAQISETTVAQIFFKKPAAGGHSEKATLVASKLSAGESFETLASQYSEDDNFSEGGVLGVFKPGELATELDVAMKKLAVGEISGIIESRRGFHILKVLKRSFVSDPGLENEKNKIRGILSQQAFKKQFQFWLDQKRREAFIRINGA